jgi:imidazolonepropionase-like amidohydrolase
MAMKRFALAAMLCGLVVMVVGGGCAPAGPLPGEGTTAFVGASLFDGRGVIENAVMLVRDGKIVAAGTAADVAVPEGAEKVDLAGRFVTPGLILGHGHVGGSKGLETGPAVYTNENLQAQLGLYARYGVTTVVSLGGDGPEAIQLRDAQNTADLDRARIFVAGKIVDADTPDGARQMVDEDAAMKVDFVKIRVDDNLGTTKKMTPEVYQAVIEQAHQHKLPVAVHLYYLDDAKAVLKAGADNVAHSVRDKEVDQELIDLLKEKNVCLCPTLTREVSTYVYESVPEFFSDPFFLRDADPQVLEQLKDPARQAGLQKNKAAQQYKKALEVAMANLKKLSDAGVRIVFGTDTGPPARFQGYFEHLELDLMAKAGLTPEQIVRSATSEAARCMKLDGVGSLEAGKWADFVVFAQNPLADIANSKSLESVWIAGSRVPEKAAPATTD